MRIFDKLFGKPEPEIVQKPEEPAAVPPVKKVKKTAKELATEKGEPWVGIISVELDPENIGQGAFELDWNDKFLAQLVRAGYQVRPNEPENEIVDRWFASVCRNVALETYEQDMADPDNRIRVERRDIGNGRTEIG